MPSVATGAPTKNDIEKLRAARKHLTLAVNKLEQCKRCKVDVGERGDLCDYLVGLYTALSEELGITLE